MERGLPFKRYYCPMRRYLDLYMHSVRDPEGFWDDQARQLEWFKTWDKVLEWEAPYARWFIGGEINASYLCLDRHVKTWRKSKVAIYWEGEPGDSRVLSYSTLYREVNRWAKMLKDLGVKKGDRVALYLPMILELPIAMLACARLGAIHTVVFSGFSAQALADRVNDTEAKLLITADGGYRRGKVVELKRIADEALSLCPSVEKSLVVRRIGTTVEMKEDRDLFVEDVIEKYSHVPPEPMEATHPLYILYTSGTTGKPKGIVHSTGGYLTYNYCSYKWAFDIREESVYWCTADVGWVTGHSSVIYAPLMHGASMVIYEGAPDYPAPDRWWEIIEKYGVSIFYTSPTAIRMFMRYGEEWLKKHDLSTLELLGSVGETINPEAWLWLFEKVGEARCPIVDTWWQTETGGFMIAPAPGIERHPMKPGSASFPLPGVQADIVDEEGRSLPAGEKGYLVLKAPWPGMLTDVYNDPDRYRSTYWSRFPGVYFSGDFAIRDEDGYFWVLGRADEVLKIAGHRIGTAEIEDAAAAHPKVAEAAVATVPDPVKGEEIVLFTILKEGVATNQELKEEIRKYIREAIGPIATPKEIYLVSKLPKTRSGKIMRRILRAVATGSAVGDISTLEDEASVEEVKRAYEELRREI